MPDNNKAQVSDPGLDLERKDCDAHCEAPGQWHPLMLGTLRIWLPPNTHALRVPNLRAPGGLKLLENPGQNTSPRLLTWGFKKSG
ncbi:hypothetical protein [Streptomyces sp. NPDC001450]